MPTYQFEDEAPKTPTAPSGWTFEDEAPAQPQGLGVGDTNKSTLGAFARTLTRIPENLIASGITAIQGPEGASVTDRGILDRFVNTVQERNRTLAEEYKGAGDFIPGLITKQEVAQLGENVGFMGASMGGTVAGAVAAGLIPVPGARIAGGVAGGYLAGSRMQGYNTMNDWLNQKNEESLRLNKRPITPDEETAFKSQYMELAKESGFWEGAPESAGNVAVLALLGGKRLLTKAPGPVGAAAKLIPDSVLMKVAKAVAKMGAVFGVEELTETITGLEQHNVEVKAGMLNEPLREWSNPDDILKSAKEVLGPVLLLTGAMGAGSVAAKKLSRPNPVEASLQNDPLNQEIAALESDPSLAEEMRFIAPPEVPPEMLGERTDKGLPRMLDVEPAPVKEAPVEAEPIVSGVQEEDTFIPREQIGEAPVETIPAETVETPAEAIAPTPSVFTRMPDEQLQKMADQGVRGAIDEVAKRAAPVAEAAPEAIAEPPPPEIVQPGAAAGGKQPWEMTRGEYAKYHDKLGDPLARRKGELLSDHEYMVKQALSEGKPVSSSVLKDYPDLKPAPLTPEVGATTPTETLAERADRTFQETQAKFAEEAASTETITEREQRRKAEATPRNAAEVKAKIAGQPQDVTTARELASKGEAVAYHGTKKELKGPLWAQQWYSTMPEVADGYHQGGGKTYQVKIKIETPWIKSEHPEGNAPTVDDPIRNGIKYDGFIFDSNDHPNLKAGEVQYVPFDPSQVTIVEGKGTTETRAKIAERKEENNITLLRERVQQAEAELIQADKTTKRGTNAQKEAAIRRYNFLKKDVESWKGALADATTEAKVIPTTKAAETAVTTPKEQKAYVLDKVDGLIVAARERFKEQTAAPKEVVDKDIDENIIKGRFASEIPPTGAETVTIEVPNDGNFKIPNTLRGLLTFQRNMKRMETSTKPSEGYIPAPTPEKPARLEPGQQEPRREMSRNLPSNKRTGKTAAEIEKEAQEEADAITRARDDLRDEYTNLRDKWIPDAEADYEKWWTIKNEVYEKKRTLKSLAKEFKGKVPSSNDLSQEVQRVRDRQIDNEKALKTAEATIRKDYPSLAKEMFGETKMGEIHPGDTWGDYQEGLDGEIRQTWKTKLEGFVNDSKRTLQENRDKQTPDSTSGIGRDEVSLLRGLRDRRLFDEEVRGANQQNDRQRWQGVEVSSSFADTPELKLAEQHFASLGYQTVPVTRLPWGMAVNPNTKVVFMGEMKGDNFAYFMSHETSHILSNQGNAEIAGIKEAINLNNNEIKATRKLRGWTEDYTRDEYAAAIVGGMNKPEWVKGDQTANIKTAREAATSDGKPTGTVKTGPSYGFVQPRPPAFYSKLSQIVQNASFTKMPLPQLRAMLKGKQVTDAEIESILGRMEGTVTKQQVLDEIKVNGTEFKDVVLGGIGGGERVLRNDDMTRLRDIIKATDQLGFDSVGEAANSVIRDGADLWDWNTTADRDEVRRILDRKESPTHFSQYTEPGAVLGSYREMFVTAPGGSEYQIVPHPTEEGFAIRKPDGTYIIAANGKVSQWETMFNADNYGMPAHAKDIWQDGHSQYSDIANPIVRIRFNERKIEVPMEGSYAKDTQNILFVEEMQGPSEANQGKMPEHLRKRIYDIGVKRVLAYAKENGFDGVAWTPGEMQAARYDLSKQIDVIAYDYNGNTKVGRLSAWKNGVKEPIIEKGVPVEQLPEYIGKEAAQKIVDQIKPNEQWTMAKLENADLKVGGEGLKSLYDRTLPSMFKKYGKEGVGEVTLTRGKGFIGTVGKGELDTGEITAPFIPITPNTPASYTMYGDVAPKTDAAYLKAVESGDMATAQRMVDEAAKRSGYTSPRLFRGSVEDDGVILPESFEVGGGIFLTDSEDVAQIFRYTREYGEVLTSQYDEETGEDVEIEPGPIIEAYVKLTNPLILTRETDVDSKDFVMDTTIQTRAIKQAQKDSYDGIVVQDTKEGVGDWMEEGTTYVVFRSEQVKSADPVTYNAKGNVIPLSERFNEKTPDIRYGDITPTPGTWDAPEVTRMSEFIRSFVDRHVYLRQAVGEIKKVVGNLDDAINPDLRERLFTSTLAQKSKEFLEKEWTPYLAEVRKEKFHVDQQDEFLWYRTAEETNAHDDALMDALPVGSKERMRREAFRGKGSGKSQKEIDAYYNSLTPQQLASHERLAAITDKMLKKNNDLRVEYILETRKTVSEWEKIRPHYAPLFREEIEGGSMGTGAGFSVTGPTSKRQTGSGREVVDIHARIAEQRDMIYSKGEKNRIGTALYGLVKMISKTNPDASFWSIAKPGLVKNAIDKDTGKPVPDLSYRHDPNVLMSRQLDKNGNIVERGVEFNVRNTAARMTVEALKNMDMDNLGAFLGVSAKITRFIASMNTQFNPIFGITNFVRDVQFALLSISASKIKGKQKQVMAYTMPALKAIYGDLRNKGMGDVAEGSMEWWWRDFGNHGGPTGFRDIFRTTKDRANKIKKEMAFTDSSTTVGKIYNTKMAIQNWLSDYNSSLENAVRLSAYRVACETIDPATGKYITHDQAAVLAKSLTVDFNKKGQIATQAGAMYAFFNASAQGIDQMVKVLRGPTGSKIIMGGITAGAVQAMILAAAGFDDKDIPEFIRERNFIIWTGGKDYFLIPMPLGFNVIPNLGRIPAEFAMSGFKDPMKRTTDLLGIMAESFNPLGGSGLSLQTVTPTVLDPFVALSSNKDWTNKPIFREDFSSMAPKPGLTRTKDSASWFSKKLAWAFNKISGGSEHVPGMFSPTGDEIDYLMGQVTGGLGREALKIASMVEAVQKDTEIPPYRIPLVGRFYGSTEGQANEASRFYGNLKTLNRHEDEIKGRRKSKEPLGDYLKENPEARYWVLGNRVGTSIARLNQRKRHMVERGASNEAVNNLNTLITSHMRRFNDTIKKAEL